ncbi:hypothetical protein [Sphaerisporangium dianthi]|uniref:Uncharacterized protein n=1 Tax=Sphaerisporangium dianthi TaxID=1436120 RepID=A0ABV9CGG9_9ACTN
MNADEIQWTFMPDADRAKRLMRLLFDPQADEAEQAPDMEEGEAA